MAYRTVYSERDYAPEEFEFLMAVAAYQKRTGRKFLDACEYRDVLLALGYRRVAHPDGEKS